ncbi:MAG: ImmA/IrrE family metallo-endopeptidase [Lachnospiraceae bacterium]|nr:ImmA/IrrE family metallo-endopeptidase [Lachnospiraceae bacterium]
MEIIKPKPKLLNDISEIVDSLIEKYGCKNPFYIAKRLGIDYYFMDFNPDLLAFSERDGDKDPGRIYVAKDIGAAAQKFLASHELAHILMHDHGNNLFDQGIDPCREFQANYFTSLLMMQFEISNKVDVQCIEKFNQFMTSKIKYMIKLEKENPQEHKPERFFALYPDGKKYISFDYLTGEVEVIMPIDTKNILRTV